MKQTHIVFVLGALLCLEFSLAFSAAPVPAVLTRSGFPSTSTCLFSEEGTSGEAPQQSNDDDDADSSTDILNSPAFLKRKIDVLKSDIAKAEEDIAAAKQRLDEGKAEWGGQLDELQKEVSGDDFGKNVPVLGMFFD